MSTDEGMDILKRTATVAGMDVLQLHHQLVASEAYNRFMDRRVKQLERELALFTTAQTETMKVKQPHQRAEGSSSVTQETAPLSVHTTVVPIAQHDAAVKERDALSAECVRLKVALQKKTTERDAFYDELLGLKQRYSTIEADLRATKTQLTGTEDELNALKELLPASLRSSSTKVAQTQSVKDVTIAPTPEQQQPGEAGMTNRRRARSTLASAGPTEAESPTVAEPPLDVASNDAAAQHLRSMSETSQSSVDVTQCHFEPIFNGGESAKDRMALLLVRTAPLDAALKRALRPPDETSLANLIERLRKAFTEMKSSVERIPSLASRLQMARRDALAALVESQATSTPSKAAQSRIIISAKDLQSQRESIAAIADGVATTLGLVAGGVVTAVTVLMALGLRFPSVGGPQTVAKLDQLLQFIGRVALLDVNYLRPLMAACVNPRNSVDCAMADLADAFDHPSSRSVPRYDIDDLKRMSAECRETAINAVALTNCVDLLNVAATKMAEVKRLANMAQKAAAMARAEGAADGGEDATSPPPGALTFAVKGTQVNFFKFRSEPTAEDLRIAQLASIRQPWFECLQHVVPVARRSPSPAASRRRSPGPHRRDSPESSPEPVAKRGDDAADAAPVSDEAGSHTAAIDGVPQPINQLHFVAKSHTVTQLVEEYHRRNVPLPPGFRSVRGDVYQFGSRRILLHIVGDTLAVKIGGGYITLEEYSGLHYAGEMRKFNMGVWGVKTTNAPRVVDAGTRGRTPPSRMTAGNRSTQSPAKVVLPDTPVVTRHGRKRSSPAASSFRDDAASTSTKRAQIHLTDEMRDRLAAMGITEDEYFS